MKGAEPDKKLSISLSDSWCNLAGDADLCTALVNSLEPYIEHSSTARDGWTVCAYRTPPILKRKPDFTDDLGSRMFVDAGARKISVENPRFEYLLLSAARQVRGVLRLNHFAANGLSVHGAMVARKGKGVLLVGEKRAGKTSLVLSLLRSHAWTFVCNDDTTLHATSAGFEGRGWPRAVRVRRETFFLLEALCEVRAKTVTLSHPDNPGVSVPADLPQIKSDVLLMLPSEIAALADKAPEPSAPLGLVVFPTVDPALKGSVAIESLVREQGERRLLACIAPFTSLPGGKFLPHLRPHFATPEKDQIRAALARDARQIRYVELRHSFATILTAPAALEAWMDEATKTDLVSLL